MTKILVIGAGGREHALAWKLNAVDGCQEILTWPPHAVLSKLYPTPPALPHTATYDELAVFCKNSKIDAVVVGPEQPLANGIADTMQTRGIPCFGPNAEAAQLESSKAFAKNMMKAANIPTAQSREAKNREECERLAFGVLNKDEPVVLKASGLAGGKGVFVCRTKQELENGLQRLYTSMSSSSEIVLVEDFLVGRECSFFCFVGNETYTPLGFAVDYKRLNDQDQGPNTGGMGGYSPVAWLPSNASAQVETAVVQPLLSTLKNKGISYTGFLYVGLMWHPEKGPQVVEFNCRLGDPEAQILALASEANWMDIIFYHLGLGAKPEVGKKLHPTVGVVMTSTDYPYLEELPGIAAHFPLKLFEPNPECAVFGAAVKLDEDRNIISGRGRVLTCVARGTDLKDARNKAYKKVGQVKETWPQSYNRNDIASSSS